MMVRALRVIEIMDSLLSHGMIILVGVYGVYKLFSVHIRFLSILKYILLALFGAKLTTPPTVFNLET